MHDFPRVKIALNVYEIQPKVTFYLFLSHAIAMGTQCTHHAGVEKFTVQGCKWGGGGGVRGSSSSNVMLALLLWEAWGSCSMRICNLGACFSMTCIIHHSGWHTLKEDSKNL